MRILFRQQDGGYIAYFAGRPINGPYGIGPTQDAARADLEEWMRASKQRMAGSHNRI